MTGKYNREIPADSRLGSSADPYVGTLAQRLKTPEGISDLAKVAKMIELAQELDCTAAQVALAWCIKNPNVSSVITGASKPSQVLENCKCLAVLPKLTDAVMARIEDVFQNAPSKAVARH